MALQSWACARGSKRDEKKIYLMPFGQTKVHTHAHFKTFFFCLLSYFLHFLLPFRSSVAAYKEYSRVPGPRDKRLWAKLQRLSLVTPPHKIHISHCPRHYGLMPRRERRKEGKRNVAGLRVQAETVPKEAGQYRELGAGKHR